MARGTRGTRGGGRGGRGITRDQWTWVLVLSAPTLLLGFEAFAFTFVVWLFVAWLASRMAW